MPTLPVFHSVPYKKKVFRNIFTNATGQHIHADVCDPEDYSLVETLIALTSGIDHNQPQFHRPFQYAVIEDDQILQVFEREHWNYGRFGDGKSYGVWYAAEDEITSVTEACWVAYQLAKDNVLPKGEVYHSERAMYLADVDSKASLDLTKEKTLFNQLVHPSDYKFCQALGKKIVESKIEVLRTLSARKKGGICNPIFSPTPIKNPQRIYYLKINVYPDGEIGVDSSQELIRNLFQATDLQSPYKDGNLL